MSFGSLSWSATAFGDDQNRATHSSGGENGENRRRPCEGPSRWRNGEGHEEGRDPAFE